MTRGTIFLSGAVCALFAGACAVQPETPPEVVVLLPEGVNPGAMSGGFYVDFAEDIKPLLERNCLRCHHTGSGESKLSFESRRHVLEANSKYQLIIPGEPERSSLFLVTVIPDHYAEAMPRGSDGHRLSKGDTWLLYQWIATGAEWPEDSGGSLQPRAPGESGETPPPEKAEPEKKASPRRPGITSSPPSLPWDPAGDPDGRV